MKQEQRNKKAEQLRIAAQIIETGCEWEAGSRIVDSWFIPTNIGDPVDAIRLSYEIRIKQPVIPVPEGYRELRDDEKDGRWIDGGKFLMDDKWESVFGDSMGCCAFRTIRVIVPVSKPRVPLGPEDVPPGSVIRAVDSHWKMVMSTSHHGICYAARGHVSELRYRQMLENNWLIKRPTDTEFQPCSKPAP